MTKRGVYLLGVILILVVAVVLWLQEQGNGRLRNEISSLRLRLEQLRIENENLPNRTAPPERPISLASDRLRELLRLRNQVGLLKRRERELEQALAAAGARAPGPVQSTQDAAAGPGVAQPFQIQLVLDEPGDDAVSLTNHAGGETLKVGKTPLLDHTAVDLVEVATNPATGEPEINVEFSEVGKELFAQVTKEYINKRLAIVLDGQVYAAPLIRSEISGGKAQITGNFTDEEARLLASKINQAIIPR